MQLSIIMAQINPGSLPLVLLSGKRTVIELHCRIQLRAQERKYPGKFRVISTWVPIKEAIQPSLSTDVLFAVAMEIDDEPNLPFLTDLLDKCFNTDDFGAT